MHKGFVWNRKCILLGSKHQECVASVLSDTLNGRADVFLALTDNAKPVWSLLRRMRQKQMLV